MPRSTVVALMIVCALPFVAVGVPLLVWICRRLPAGWRRWLNGATAAGTLVLLASFGWNGLLNHFTSACYVCIDCGRTETQLRFAEWTLRRKLHWDGAAYSARFVTREAADVPHDWHLESCLCGLGSISCTMEAVEDWFRVLPALADRDAADELVREARALPRDERCRLMDEFGEIVGRARYDADFDVDSAVSAWRAERR